MKKLIENIALSVLAVAVFGAIYALLAVVYLWRIGGL